MEEKDKHEKFFNELADRIEQLTAFASPNSDVSLPLGHVKAKLITEREFQHAFLELLCGRAKSSSLPEMWFIDCTGQCNFTRVGCGAS